MLDLQNHIGQPRARHHHTHNANVNFASLLPDRTLQVRTFERGVEGETLACGTGAAAAMVAARLEGLVGERAEVRQPGGTLTLEWDGAGEVYLTGPAAEVFEGEWPE